MNRREAFKAAAAGIAGAALPYSPAVPMVMDRVPIAALRMVVYYSTPANYTFGELTCRDGFASIRTGTVIDGITQYHSHALPVESKEFVLRPGLCWQPGEAA